MEGNGKNVGCGVFDGKGVLVGVIACVGGGPRVGVASGGNPHLKPELERT